MHSLSISGIFHQGGRRVAECGPVAKVIGGVGDLSVYITPKFRSFGVFAYCDRDFLVF